MDVILIPGFWLDGSSWAEVTPTIEKAGHRARPLTLPGMESPEADRSEITLRDHVEAVVAEIDALDPADGPVVLVGHSGGGAVAHADPGRHLRRPADRALAAVHPADRARGGDRRGAGQFHEIALRLFPEMKLDAE